MRVAVLAARTSSQDGESMVLLESCACMHVVSERTAANVSGEESEGDGEIRDGLSATESLIGGLKETRTSERKC